MPSDHAQRPELTGRVGRSERSLSRSRACVPLLGAWLMLSSWVPLAHAQQQPTGDIARQRAAETFRQGVEAFDKRDFETARVAFLQTLALRPMEAAVQRNLGLAEIYSGHYLDGARRLARVLQTTSQGSSEERSRMQDSLKKAETHLQRITVEVDVEGADIVVEGTELGRSPLPFAWYLAPGPYDLSVSKPGYRSVTRAGLGQAGKAEHLRIELEPIVTEPPPPVVQTAPLPPPEPAVPVARGRSPSPWLVAGGVVLSAAGLATGVTFSVLANGNADESARRAARLLGQGENCTDPPLPPECPSIMRPLEQHDRQVNYALVGYTAGATLALMTLAYALWLAPEESTHGRASGSSRAVGGPPRAFVSVDRDGANLLVTTAF